MRQELTGHTDSDTACSVQENRREKARENLRFLLRLIEIRNKIHGVLLDILQEQLSIRR